MQEDTCMGEHLRNGKHTHEWSSSNKAAVYGLLAFFTLFIYIFIAGGIDSAPKWFISLLAKPLRVSPGMLEARGIFPSRVIIYRLEQWFWSHPYSKLILLLVLTVSMISLGSVGLFAVSSSGSLYDTMWAAVAGVGLDWSFFGESNEQGRVLVRLVSLVIAIGGTLITALLLGIVSDALSQKVDELRRGRGAVLECNHYIIIGWSDKVLSLIDQLCQGFELNGGTTIVVLSHMGKEEMEEEIATRVRDRRGSTVIVRKGDAMARDDLININCSHASSIVILANTTSPEQSDARVLRIVMCLMGIIRQVEAKGRECKTNILAEMCNSDHESLLRMLVDEPRVWTIVSREMIGRFSVQCARYPALTNVLMELLGFAGNEFYLTEHKYTPQLLGYKFSQMQQLFRHAVPCGIREASGVSRLSPSSEMVMGEGDQLILLAEDESGCHPTFDEHSPLKPSPKQVQLHKSKSKLKDESSNNNKSKSSFGVSMLMRAAAQQRTKRQSESAARSIALQLPSKPKRFSEAACRLKGLDNDEEGDEGGSQASSGDICGKTSIGGLASNDVETGGSSSPQSLCKSLSHRSSAEGIRSAEKPEQEGAAGAAAAEQQQPSKGVRGLVRFSSSTKQRVQAKEEAQESEHQALPLPPLQEQHGHVEGQDQKQQHTALQQQEEEEQQQQQELQEGIRAKAKEALLAGGLAPALKAIAAKRDQAGSRRPSAPGADKLESSISSRMPRKWSSRKTTSSFGMSEFPPGLAKSVATSETKAASHGSLAFRGVFLFCGWRQDIVGLIHVLDDFVTEDSELWLFSDVPLDVRRNLLVQGGLDIAAGLYCGLRKLKIRFDDPRLFGSSVIKRHLQALFPIQFTAILLLADEPRMNDDSQAKAAGGATTSGKRSVADIDSHTLSTLVLLRQIQVEDIRSGRLAPREPLFKDPLPSPSPPSSQSDPQADCEEVPEHSEMAAMELTSQDSLPGVPSIYAGADAAGQPHGTYAVPQQSVLPRSNSSLQRQPGAHSSSLLPLYAASSEQALRLTLTPTAGATHSNAQLRPSEAATAEPTAAGAAWQCCEGEFGPAIPLTSQSQPWLDGCLIENPVYATPASSDTSLDSDAGPPVAHERRSRKQVRGQLYMGISERCPLPGHPVARSLQPQIHEHTQSSGVLTQSLGSTAQHDPSHGLDASDLLQGIQAQATCPVRSLPDATMQLSNGHVGAGPKEVAGTWSDSVAHEHWRGSIEPAALNKMQHTSSALTNGPRHVHGPIQRQCSSSEPALSQGQGSSFLGQLGWQHSYPGQHHKPPPLLHSSSLQCTSGSKQKHPVVCLASPPASASPSSSMQRSGSVRPPVAPPVANAMPQHHSMQQRHCASRRMQTGSSSLILPPPMVSPTLGIASGVWPSDAPNKQQSSQAVPAKMNFRSVSQALLAVGSMKRRPPRHGMTPGGVHAAEGDEREEPDPVEEEESDMPAPLTRRDGNKWLSDPLLAQAVAKTVVVAELLDGSAHDMLKDIGIAQYMLSNELLSKLLALVATCPERADILEVLLQAGGVELYLRPTWWLVEKGEAVSFVELSARASSQGEILVGIIEKATRKSFLNPANKLEPCLSRATVEALVTTAWS